MIVYHGAMPKTLENVASKSSVDVLYSFAVHKKTEWFPWWNNLFIDSGAYSVWKANKKISIDDYLAYIYSWEDKRKIVFAGLDVIGDPEKSYENYLWIHKQVPKNVVLIPTIHFGEDVNLLKKYVKKTNYIGIGASVGRSTIERTMYLDRIFSLYPNPEEIGFHGFGVTAPKLMTRYPWKTLDSTRAFRWAINGLIETPFGNFRVGRSSKDSLRPETKLGKLCYSIVKEWVESQGINWENVSDFEKGFDERLLLNIRTIEHIAKGSPINFSGHTSSHFLDLR